MAKIDDAITQQDWKQVLALVSFNPQEKIKLESNSFKILIAENSKLYTKIKEILSRKKQELVDADFLSEKFQICYRASGLKILSKDTSTHNSIIRLFLFFQLRLYILANAGAADKVNELVVHAQGVLLRMMPLGFSPLFFAAQNGHTKTCEALLATGLISQEQKEVAFFAAVKKGYSDVCKLLLDNGVSADIKEKGVPAVLVAGRNKHLKVVQLLMGYKVDAFACAMGGMNVFHAAAASGALELCRILLDYTHNKILEVKQSQLPGAPNFGFSPLHCAALHGHIDVCQLLLERGANINLTDVVGCTSLNLAAQEAADPDTKEEARVRVIALCEFLLSRGADPDQPDRDFVTARKRAENSNVRELKELFMHRFPRQDVPVEQAVAFIKGEISELPKVKLPASAAEEIVPPRASALNFQNEEQLLLVVAKGNLIACNNAFVLFPWEHSNFSEFRQKLLDIAKMHCHPQLWLLIKQYKPGEALVKNDRQYNGYFFCTFPSAGPREAGVSQLRELKFG